MFWGARNTSGIWRTRNSTFRLKNGDLDVMDWPRSKSYDPEIDMGLYGEETQPGPVTEGSDIFDVEAIFGVEGIANRCGKIKPHFAVEWRGWGKEYNTLEPFENVANTKDLDVFLRCFVTTNSAGSYVRSVKRGKRAPPKEPNIDYQSYKGFASLTVPGNVIGGDNEFERSSNDLLAKFVEEDRFWQYLGFIRYNNNQSC